MERRIIDIKPIKGKWMQSFKIFSLNSVAFNGVYTILLKLYYNIFYANEQPVPI